jgi:hypothetical protein
MSRAWLNRPGQPGDGRVGFEADDLCAGVMVVDLAGPTIRPEVSADFQT